MMRREFRRNTMLNRSFSPYGATTMKSSFSSRRTATQVAGSGHVAIASDDDTSGSTGKPNTRSYHKCTAAWFFASQGTPGKILCNSDWISWSYRGVRFDFHQNPFDTESSPRLLMRHSFAQHHKLVRTV